MKEDNQQADQNVGMLDRSLMRGLTAWAWLMMGFGAIAMFTGSYLAGFLLFMSGLVIKKEFIIFIDKVLVSKNREPVSGDTLLGTSALLFVLALIVGIFGSNSNSEPKPPATPYAKPFKVLKIETFPAPEDRKRLRVIIYSKDAKTFDERAQTAMLAAYSTWKADPRNYEIDVWLEAKPKISERVAFVSYYPYKETAFGEKKKTDWVEVQATDFDVEKDWKNRALGLYLKDYKLPAVK